jgi:eukaryotic-like serine/threonine-protein kinase
MGVSICAAVQNGRAVGITVVTSPRNPGIESCVAGGVRNLRFPSHPKLDVTRTKF